MKATAVKYLQPQFMNLSIFPFAEFFIPELQIGREQRKGGEKEFGAAGIEQECLSVGWFLFSFACDLFISFRR